jgi:GNAT superfamily N-acetyltransferase
MTVGPATPAEANVWARTVAQGFVEQPEIPPALLEIVELPGHAPGVTCFLARVDGQPAGGATLVVQQGVALVNGASTLPPFRRQGVQTALLQARRAAAAAAGCDLAMTCTRPGTPSQRNVERQGFQVAYTRVVLVKDCPS